MDISVLNKLLNDLSLKDSSDLLEVLDFENVTFRGTNELVFNITIKRIINPELIHSFTNKTTELFSVFEVNFDFNVECEITIDDVNKYFKYYLKKLDFYNQIQYILDNRKVIYDTLNNEARLIVYSNYEMELVYESLQLICREFNSIGIILDFECEIADLGRSGHGKEEEYCIK